MAAKNGIQGILYLESDPKLPVDMPTAKAKMRVKIKKNKRLGSLMMVLNVFRKPLR